LPFEIEIDFGPDPDFDSLTIVRRACGSPDRG